MKSIISFLLIAIGLFASCNRSGSVATTTEVEIPDSIAPFLGLFYGMDKDEHGNYVDSILDVIPCLHKFEKSAIWCNPEDSMKYNASMGLYIDTVFPSPKIRSVLLSLTDSLLRVEESDNHVWNKMPRFAAYDDRFTISSFLDFWSILYDKVAITKAPPKHSDFPQVLDFRWCVVIHKIYEDDKVATYLVGESWDFHGSCGCPSQSSYLTFDKQTGAILALSDIIARYNRDELGELLYKSYCSQPMARKNGYVSGDVLVSEADGVAQIGNSYLFYYHPYKIGCGAEGQYNLFVPHNE